MTRRGHARPGTRGGEGVNPAPDNGDATGLFLRRAANPKCWTNLRGADTKNPAPARTGAGVNVGARCRLGGKQSRHPGTNVAQLPLSGPN